MKTLRHIALLAIALIAASSCTTDEYYNDTNEENWFADDFEISGSHWKLVGEPNEIGSYYEYIFDEVIGEEVYYSIQYTYDVKADGTIAFKVYVSNYFTKDFRPGTQHFRVAIVW